MTGQRRSRPLGLAVAEEMQERLCPAEVILLGSRATGDHRPDSDVGLMAACPSVERDTDRLAGAWTFGNTRLRPPPSDPGKAA